MDDKIAEYQKLLMEENHKSKDIVMSSIFDYFIGIHDGNTLIVFVFKINYFIGIKF